MRLSSKRHILKCMWKFQEPRASKTTLKKNKVGGLILLDIKTYFDKFINHKNYDNVVYHKNRPMTNRPIKQKHSPELDPLIYEH